MMIVTDTKTLGERIRATRKRQGLTQEELAASAGVGTRFVRELELGKPTSQIAKALLVLEMLGLEIRLNARGEPD